MEVWEKVLKDSSVRFTQEPPGHEAVVVLTLARGRKPP